MKPVNIVPSYYHLREQIQDGDALLFANPRRLVDRLISWRTSSPWVHIGLAYWLEGQRLCSLEAQERYGVRLCPVSDYLRQGYRVAWFQLSEKSGISRQRMSRFALNKLGRNYIPLWKLAALFAGLAPLVRTEGDWFCSMLYAGAAQDGGARLSKPIDEHDPADFARFPFLHYRSFLG